MKMPMDWQTFQFFPELDGSDLPPQVFGDLLPLIQTVVPRHGRFIGAHTQPQRFRTKETLVIHMFRLRIIVHCTARMPQFNPSEHFALFRIISLAGWAAADS